MEIGGNPLGSTGPPDRKLTPWEWPIFPIGQLRHSQGGLKRPTGPNITERPRADRISPNKNVTWLFSPRRAPRPHRDLNIQSTHPTLRHDNNPLNLSDAKETREGRAPNRAQLRRRRATIQRTTHNTQLCRTKVQRRTAPTTAPSPVCFRPNHNAA